MQWPPHAHWTKRRLWCLTCDSCESRLQHNATCLSLLSCTAQKTLRLLYWYSCQRLSHYQSHHYSAWFATVKAYLSLILVSVYQVWTRCWTMKDWWLTVTWWWSSKCWDYCPHCCFEWECMVNGDGRTTSRQWLDKLAEFFLSVMRYNKRLESSKL